jgi:hypothetical protein
MSLSKQEIEGLLKLIGQTCESEINCDQCLEQISEFAESSLQGKTVAESLKAVEQHLAICGECCEEYEVLKKIIESLEE